MAVWRKDQVTIDFLDELVDHPVVTVKVATPAGELRVMAVPSQRGRTVLLSNLHVHGELTFANQVGAANLMVVA